MSLHLNQSLKLTQSLVMTPQLQQSLKLLAMNRLELEEAIEMELNENPTLEAIREEYLEQEPSRETEWEPQTERPSIDQTLGRRETLEEHLLWQVQMSAFNVLEREIAERLIGEINEKGFLDLDPEHQLVIFADGPVEPEPLNTPAAKLNTLDRLKSLTAAPAPERPSLRLDAIAEALLVPPEWVESVRQRMMRMDPIGCLAIDARECLLVQLEAQGFDDETIEFNLIQRHLERIEKRDYRPILKDLDIDLQDLSDALKVIERLEPIPARAFNLMSAGQMSVATPDVHVVPMGDDFAVVLNENGLPRLKLSQFYLDQIANKNAGDSAPFVKDKIRAATWLIRSIHQRQRSILRVTECLVRLQHDWFFSQGPIKPLVLKTVADEIGVHESTVSRVTSGKYVQTSRGIFELKHFFSSTVANADGSTSSSDALREALQKLIKAEDPDSPLSDQDLVQILKEKNFDVARRTVAKYREDLGIESSSKRRRRRF